jgi:hypothetical protein
MNDVLLSPRELEALGRKNGWSLAALCREAKVAPSNFSRWKGGSNGMTLRIYQRVYAVAVKKFSTAKTGGEVTADDFCPPPGEVAQ